MANKLGSENVFPIVRMLGVASPPSTPPTDELHLFVDEATKTLWWIDDTGATQDIAALAGGYAPGGTDVAVADGGTGASSAATARSNLGITAANTPITDSGAYFTGTDVEAALQELGAGGGGGGGALDLIDSDTLGSAAANITIGSIPNTYRDLVIVARLRGTTAAAVVDTWLRAGNGSADSGGNYMDSTTFTGAGSGGVSGTAQTQVYMGPHMAASGTASIFSFLEITIYDYASASNYKNLMGRALSTGPNTYITTIVGSWRNAAVLDLIQLRPDSGNFDTGSSLHIYGRG